MQKVETAGDCYIVAAGILKPDDSGFYDLQEGQDAAENAQRVLAFSKDILRCSQKVGAASLES